MDIEDVISWLREGEEWKAAELLSQCEFEWEYVNTGWAIGSELEITICDLKVHAPRSILNNLAKELSDQVNVIESTIRECAQSEPLAIQNIHWVPRLRSTSSFPLDQDTEFILQKINSEHIKAAWSKALQRRGTDPGGAITAAKTLVEAVCKQILTDSGVAYSKDLDINQLYFLVSKQLNLSTELYLDKNIKRILGNCQAVIGGISFLRNKLGDAHAIDPEASLPGEEEAELAVNFSGAMATFLVKVWDKQKQNNSRLKSQNDHKT